MPSLTYSTEEPKAKSPKKSSPLRKAWRAMADVGKHLLIEGLALTIATQTAFGAINKPPAMPSNHNNAPTEISDVRTTSREIAWETGVSNDGVFYAMRLCYIHYVRKAGFVSKKMMRSWATGLIDYYREHPLKIAAAAAGVDFSGASIVSSASNTNYSSPDIAFGPDYIGAGVSSYKSDLSPLLVIALLEHDLHSSSSPHLDHSTAIKLQKLIALVQHYEILNSLGHHSESSAHAEARTEEIHASKIQLLAHLANGQADQWFYLRLGAHRHSDDVDHEAEEHATQEAMAELASEISAELHMHLPELHRDFAAWWSEWHGHSGEAMHEAAFAGEAIDGQDHEEHDYSGSYGRHVAEYFWAMMHAWGLTSDDLYDHDHLHRQHLHIAHSGEHADVSHASGRMEVAGFEAEEMDDFNGSRHGYHGQADGWWMYRGGAHGHSVSSHNIETSHDHVDASSHGSEANLSAAGLSDWHKIELGTSAYIPPKEILAAVMAGHDTPPKG